MKTSIAFNIAKLRQRIENVATNTERNPNQITLLAVSKTRSADEVAVAVAAGVDQIGENYLQEGLDKIEKCHGLAVTWHFIGPIQSNKTRSIAEHFDWVQSVDREKVARRLNDQRPASLAPLQICLQVNISDEDSKSGVAPSELMALAEAVAALPRLCLRGIMAIPKVRNDIAERHADLAALRGLFAQLQQRFPGVDTLSMGMSGDMDEAISEGSTMLRIGTALFGARIGTGAA